MKNILLVNGENYWQDLLPEFKVVQKLIQNTSWTLKDGRLYVSDSNGIIEPDGILWRIGAIKPTAIQTTALNLIELAQVPCINSAKSLKIGFDRLSMLSTLKSQALPVIDFNVVTKSTQLKNIEIDFPFVVKVGNYHGGFGKVLVQNKTQWQDIKDLLFVTENYATIEPFINYERDLRYLIIEDSVWAMSRKGKYWKANIETTDYKLIEPQTELINHIKRLQETLGTEILAIDILEESNGNLNVVEYNDIPGLSGFPDELKYIMANLIKKNWL